MPLYGFSKDKDRVVPETLDDLRRVTADPDILHIVTFAGRPGALWFTAKLEHDHFPPATPKNEAFNIRFINWPVKDGQLWCVISIPLTKRSLADQVAKETGMRIANGVPRLFNPLPDCPNMIAVCAVRDDPRLGIKFVESFPMDNERVWTLENDKNSEMYKSEEGRKKTLAREEREVNAIFEGFRLRN
jgi:hypothetical protein